MADTILSLHSRSIHSKPFEFSDSQKRAEALVSGFVDHVTDGCSLMVMVGGGWAYRLGWGLWLWVPAF